MRSRLSPSLGIAVVLLWATSAQSQIPVTDVANAAINTVTASQSTITAVESVLSVINQVLELTPVEEIIIAQNIATDITLLGQIVEEADQVWYDLASLQAQITRLFGLDNVPRTRAELDARLAEIKQFYYRSLCYAMATQTLIKTTMRTIDDVMRLVGSIEALVGQKQAVQTLIQVNTSMSKTLMTMEIQQAAWQRTDTIQRLTESVTIESLQRIELGRLDGHPRP